MMLVYCTGISQPPKSMSFAPSFWWAENNEVRFNIAPYWPELPGVVHRTIYGRLTGSRFGRIIPP